MSKHNKTAKHNKWKGYKGKKDRKKDNLDLQQKKLITDLLTDDNKIQLPKFLS